MVKYENRKESEEARDKRIEEIVRRKLAAERILRAHESKLEFVEEALRLLIKGYKWEDLPWSYTFDMAKHLINDREFSDEEREDLRDNFATGIIYFGSRGFKPEDQEAINNTRNAIVQILRE